MVIQGSALWFFYVNFCLRIGDRFVCVLSGVLMDRLPMYP